MLNKKYELTIDSKGASSIPTRRGETLLDVLVKSYGWNGKDPIDIIIYVFEATPLTRLGMIARDYLGGSSYDKKMQILPLNSQAATLLIKEPTLMNGKTSPGIIAGRKFYFVKPILPGGELQTSTSSTHRGNDVDLRFITPNKMRTSIYINHMICMKIKGLTYYSATC